MQRRSSSSSGAIYLDRIGRIEELRRAAISARKRVSAIRRVLLFGSLVSGTATPRSDADILIIVEDSPYEHPRDRVPEMLAALAPLPCPVDLFVLTQQELLRHEAENSPLVREALASGTDLLQ